MSGLVEFLRARLDEDEAAAISVAPTGRPLEAGRYYSWFAAGRSIGDRSGGMVTYSVDGRAAREHIVRHDPARALREVEAKRRIVAMWQVCGDLAVEGIAANLAAVYADHPDYREEWR